MINPILFISNIESALYSMVKFTEKCSISWTITEIIYEKNDSYSDKIIFFLEGKNGIYPINSYFVKSLDYSDMNYTKNFYDESNLPKIWDNVNYLIDKDFNLIANRYEEGSFRLPFTGEVVRGEINICDVEKNDDIFYIWFIWIGIFVLIIFSILLLKKTKT